MISINVRARVVFSGKKTQGIGLRKKVKEKALLLGLRGWIKNKDDGSVEAVFEGQKEKIDNIIEWCKGLDIAKIDKAEIIWEPHTGSMNDFEVIS